MPYSIQWTDNAEARLADHADFLAVRSSNAALKLLDRVSVRVSELAVLPRLAPPWARSDDPDIRQLVVDDYLIIYRVEDREQLVTILTVRHGRQRPLDGDELG